MNVTVNCVAYGFIKTRLTTSAAGESTANIDGREIKVGVNPDLLAMMEKVHSAGPRRHARRGRGRGVPVLHSRVRLRERPDADVQRRPDGDVSHAAATVPPSLDGRGHRGLSRAGAPLRRRRAVAAPRRLAPPGLHPARGLAPVRAAGFPAAGAGRGVRRRRRHAGLPAGGAGRAGQGRDSGQHRGAHDRRALHPRLRHRRAEAALAAEAGERRDAGRHRADRARLRLGPEGAAHPRPARGRRLRDRRRQDLHHQRLHRQPAGGGGAHRRRRQPGRVAGRAGDREPARLQRRPAAGEAGPACLRHRGAVLRRRARAGGEPDRREGGRWLRPADEPAALRASAARACRPPR